MLHKSIPEPRNLHMIAVKTFFSTALIFLMMAILPEVCMSKWVIDQAGRKIKVPDNPQRVISLAPSITEMIYDLGEEKRLVGATQFSNHPDAARKLPRVGSYIKLDLEKIVALKPDLCLGIKDGNPVHTVNKLESFGIPVYVIDPRNLEGIIDVVQRYGSLLGAKQVSEAIVKNMRLRIGSVVELLDGKRNKPGVFFQIDAAPIISVGENTFIHELITLAGGINLAVGAQDYPRYNWEELLILKPEIVIVASMAGGHSPEDLKSGWYKWPQIPAVKNGRVYVVDANLIDRPTPRLVDGLEQFVRIIHPELFPIRTPEER